MTKRTVMHRSFFAVLLFLYFDISAQKIEINGPAGSDQFGEYIEVLPNGNFVVIDPFYDDGAKTNVGAVHLYNGANYSLISTIKGNTNNDFVGYNGIKILPNGNFIIISSYFNDGANTFCGAITWCDANNGVSGIVSSSNSLVGNTPSCQLGNSNDSIKILPNGNYLVCSRNTANGPALSAGSVTWASQATGVSGVISAANSLIGSSSNDMIGFGGVNVKILTSGNYVVGSGGWDNGSHVDVGAATFCNGNTGLTGIISSANSLIGSQASDGVGELIGVLSNGNYVVGSRQWDNGGIVNAGASTWCDGATGRIGTVSISNSLVGSSTNDRVGGIFPLSNGNYLATSQDWDNGSSVDVGAVTFANGTIGVTGTINSSNSLIGNASNTNFEFIEIDELTNGNYVVKIPFGFGSTTWGSATTGVTGIVSSSNSLVGNATTTKLRQQIKLLPNGNYVVSNEGFRSGAVFNVGAVTWCNGATGTSGVVSITNSVVGSTINDAIGSGGIIVLPNSNYFIGSPAFDNGSVVNAGAVTWCSGISATTGTISSGNSLLGSTTSDNIGDGLLSSGSFYLPNGKFILLSQSWDNGVIANAGALTMLETSLPTTGSISSANSLVGNLANKYFLFHYIDANKAFIISPLWNNGAVLNAGAIKLIDISAGLTGIFSASTADALLGKSSFDFNNYSIKPLINGNYVLSFPYYSNGAYINAGAVTFVNPTMGISGEISNTNSCVGTSVNEFMGAAALPNGNYIIVSPNADNGSNVDAGGVAFCNGTTGFSGTMNVGNSLMGTKANDNVGSGVTVLPNQKIYIYSHNWDNGTNINAGAITYVKPNESISGAITHCNSLIGATDDPPAGILHNGVYNYAIASMLMANKIILYIDNQQTLAASLDESSVNVSPSGTYDLIANTGCRLLASITPNGASPVSGNVNGKTWIETSVPVFSGQPFVARHFEITPNINPATATSRVTLYFTQQEFTDFNNHSNSALDLPANPTDVTGKANLRVDKYAGISNNGTGLPATYTSSKTIIDPNDNDIVWNNTLNRWEVSFDVTGFSGFFVHTNPFILPLDFLYFSAQKCNTTQVCLNWKTANEQNVSHFEIERSTDGRNYSVFKNELAKNQPLNLYSATDDVSNITASKVYYRIKQIDTDSKSTLSNIQAVSLNRTAEITLYPNPATDIVSILGWQYVSSVQVFDVSGKLVLQPFANFSGMDISGLPKGLYTVKVIKKDGEAKHMKFIKQ